MFDLHAEKPMFDLYAEKPMLDLNSEKPIFDLFIPGSLCSRFLCLIFMMASPYVDFYAGKSICFTFMLRNLCLIFMLTVFDLFT
jgi:hypothetical protein